jgi:hypothetical protein
VCAVLLYGDYVILLRLPARLLAEGSTNSIWRVIAASLACGGLCTAICRTSGFSSTAFASSPSTT